MHTRSIIAGLIALSASRGRLGTGTIAVLSVLALAKTARHVLPAIIAAGLIVAVPIALTRPPLLRARDPKSGRDAKSARELKSGRDPKSSRDLKSGGNLKSGARRNA